MKRIISIIICLSLVFCLCACTDSKDNGGEDTSGKIEIQEDGTLVKDGIEGIELPDVVVKPSDKTNGNTDPDSSVSSDGSVSSGPSTNGGSQQGGSSSGSGEGSSGTEIAPDSSALEGIELPDIDF